MLTKGRVVSKKKPKATPLHGGAVKAKELFAERGRSSLFSMLKPKTPQKYISFD